MLKFSLGDIHLKICYMVHWYKFRCLRISWCTAFDTPLLPLPNQELEQLHDVPVRHAMGRMGTSVLTPEVSVVSNLQGKIKDKDPGKPLRLS